MTAPREPEVFTKGFRLKTSILSIGLYAMGIALVAVGVAIGEAIRDRRGDTTGFLVMGGGVVVGTLVLALARFGLGVHWDRALRRGLAAALQRRFGLNPDDGRAYFVGWVQAATPPGRIAAFDDVGFLAVTPEKLVYMGDSVGFELYRHQVRQIVPAGVGSAGGLTTTAPRALVYWLDPAGQECVFAVQRREARHAQEERSLNQELVEVLQQWHQFGAVPPVESALGREPDVYTRAYRAKANVVGYAVPFVAFFVPPLLALLVAKDAPERDPPAWLLVVLLGLVGLCIAGPVTAMQITLPLLHQSLRRRLALALTARLGRNPDDGRAYFVGYSPGGGIPKGGLEADRDVGFLSLTAEELCYVGDAAQFALPRQQVQVVEVARSKPLSDQGPRVMVTYHDQTYGPSAFVLERREGRTRRAERKRTLELADTLRQWHQYGTVPPPEGGPPGGSAVAAVPEVPHDRDA